MVVGMSVLLTVAMLALVTVPAFEQEERNRISIKTMESMKVLILAILFTSTSTVTAIYTSVDIPCASSSVHHLPLAISENDHFVLTG